MPRTNPEPDESGRIWREDPPSVPGTYLWRRSYQWEPVEREVTGSGVIWSHRYEQEVPIARLGGEWFY